MTSAFRASLVIFQDALRESWKILVRANIIVGKNIQFWGSVRVRIFRAREARLEKITNAALKAEGF